MSGRDVARVGLAIVYGAAGVLHLAAPAPFLLIVPDWVPFPREVVALTGICELFGATALLTRKLRQAAGAALAAYAVCVYPANIKHALDAVPATAVPLGWWYHGPRLVAQPIIVWWALFAGGLVTWPFRRQVPRR